MMLMLRSLSVVARPEDLDVKIDGQQLCVTASQDVGAGAGGRRRVFELRWGY